MTTIGVKSSKMDAIISQEQTIALFSILQDYFQQGLLKEIEQDGCNNRSRTDIALFSILQDYFQQGLLKEIQCPVVHPLHVWNSFLELNR